MNKFRNFANLLLAGALMLGMAACSDDDNENGGGGGSTDTEPYLICLGMTSTSGTSYYVVPTGDLATGTISARGKGLEQNGYRSFQIGNNSLFSIGGLGLTNANIITKDANGKLQQKSSFVFDQSLAAFEQADANNMLAIDIPTTPTGGSEFKFYILNINSGAITKTVTKPVTELKGDLDWPRITGMTINDNKVYMTFYLSNETVKPSVTRYIDKIYVAVYSYPELELIKMMEDDRAPIAGSWNAYNGIFKTETGDLYTFSNTSIANGFSQNSDKKATFLRIPKGTTDFDSYSFDVETAAGGFKPIHMQYVGNGKFFSQVTTMKSGEMTRWRDINLKCAIIDVNKKTVTYIPQIPVHDGDGGQRMSGIQEGNYFYYPMATDGAIYFYKVDVNNATAERGAKVESNFVSGSFKLN
ncbi:MAG: hypothetical protein ACLVKO_11405 [Dysgonomonas sp.]